MALHVPAGSVYGFLGPNGAGTWGWSGAGAAVTDGFDPASLLLFAVAALALAVGLWRVGARDLHL